MSKSRKRGMTTTGLSVLPALSATWTAELDEDLKAYSMIVEDPVTELSKPTFEVGQRVCVSAAALKEILWREPAEGELYRTVRDVHPEHPEKWVMLDWPFFWFKIEDVSPAPHLPPRPKSADSLQKMVDRAREADPSRPLFSWPGNPDKGIIAEYAMLDIESLEDSRVLALLIKQDAP